MTSFNFSVSMMENSCRFSSQVSIEVLKDLQHHIRGYGIAGCLLPDGIGGLAVGAVTGVPNRGIFSCRRNPDNSVTRKLRPGCFVDNRLYTAGSSWTRDGTAVTCVAVGGGLYDVKPVGRNTDWCTSMPKEDGNRMSRCCFSVSCSEAAQYVLPRGVRKTCWNSKTLWSLFDFDFDAGSGWLNRSDRPIQKSLGHFINANHDWLWYHILWNRTYPDWQRTAKQSEPVFCNRYACQRFQTDSAGGSDDSKRFKSAGRQKRGC